MSKPLSLIKKSLKIILWSMVALFFLLVLLAALIQIPAIQTKIIQQATTYVSNKTHTQVNIASVSISLPRSLVIKGLFLEDVQHDTLIYSDYLGVDISIYDLLNHKITINHLEIDGLYANVYNTATDSIFNYHFLTTAFQDTIPSTTTDTISNEAWSFNMGVLLLKNIRIHYLDAYGGMDVASNLKKLRLEMSDMDLTHLAFDLDDLNIDGLTAQAKLTESKHQTIDKPSESTSTLPIFKVDRLQIQHSQVSYDNQVVDEFFQADIIDLMLKKTSANMQQSIIELDEISLTQSDFKIYLPEVVAQTQENLDSLTPTTKNNWKVRVNAINLQDNSLTYKKGDNHLKNDYFDVDQLAYRQITFVGSDMNYSAQKTELSVKDFSATDQNGFSINQLALHFAMDAHSITAKNLEIKTQRSLIQGDINLQFPSLSSLNDSLGWLVTQMDMKNVKVSNADILYFNPQLATQPFFANKDLSTSFSGIISGPIRQLTGKKIVIKTGRKTTLQTDFTITGLPDFQSSQFDIPRLHLISGKSDLELLAATSTPQNLDLPEEISIQMEFKGSLNAFETALILESSFGSAQLTASLDPQENYSSKLTLKQLDLGKLLKDTATLGPVTLSLMTNGHGLDLKHLKANIKANASSLYFNHYNYSNLLIDGEISEDQWEGKIDLNDKNLVFNFDGLANLSPQNEQFKFNFNLLGADLKKLNFTTEDIRLAMEAHADITGNSIENLNGSTEITQIVVVSDGQQIELDSVQLWVTNTPGKSELRIQSPLLGLNYDGTHSPAELPALMTTLINYYFAFSDTTKANENDSIQFDFEIQLHDHPLITQVLFPELTRFEPGIINGSYNSKSQDLSIHGTINHMTYADTEIDQLELVISSNINELNYKISTSDIKHPQLSLDNFTIEGKVAENKISTTLSSSDNKLDNKLLISTLFEKKGNDFRVSIDSNEFYLMNNQWDISPDNYVLFGNDGFIVHNLTMSRNNHQVGINSVNKQFNDDLKIDIKNFKLYDIFGIIENDSNMIRGTLNGNILLKRVNDAYGIVADASIDQLKVTEILIGDVTLKAENKNSTNFNVQLDLSGASNELNLKGNYIPDGGEKSLNIQIEIPSLSMKTIEAFSMGQIRNASGIVSGDFSIMGSASQPEIAGELKFNNTFFVPSQLNNRIELQHETIRVKNDGLYFDNFTLLDIHQRPAVIDGSIKMTQFSNPTFALQVDTEDFLLVNSTAKDNKTFFGKLIIDSKINIKGPIELPVINAKLKIKNGSNFTFAVPENQLSTNKGQGIVEFTNRSKHNPILDQGKKNKSQYSGFTGFDLSSIIELDKLAKFRLLMDPYSNDSLVVQGEAALSFTIDQSGKMSLTGAYQLTDGSYMVSLESIIKKRFIIEKGSTITWNGDPMDAGISINAIYSVRASPINLITEQTTGISDADLNAYKQRYPFLVVLKIRGEMLQPEISFEIQLPPEEKGILGGAVEAKLSQLNENPSELNKQVFALLVLGRFVQDNPLEMGANGEASNLVRNTVSSFLSSELNKWSSKLVPGVELNFDVNSYNEYESNQVSGRTQVDIGLKKQLFDERLSVQIGGVVDVEGAKAKENSLSNVTSDVSVEYELTKDGRYRLIGFSHNQYEGAIEGQVVETGVGIIYQRDFDQWKNFFKSLNRQK